MAVKEGRKRIQITLSEKTLEKLDEFCEESGMAKNAFLEYIIASALNETIQMRERISLAVATQKMIDKE